MQDVDAMIKAALDRVETLLDAKSVIGEQVTVGEYTIIPLISMGFGFGTMAGSGKSEDIFKGEGGGTGLGGGGGIKPVAVIVVGPEGVKVESLKGASASLLDTLTSRVKNKLKNSDK